MAWYKTFDYKTDAERYIEQEEEAKKKLAARPPLEWDKDYKGVEAPTGFQGRATGMPTSFMGDDNKILQASQNIQDIEFGYEGTKKEYEETKKKHFPGLKMPNFSKVLKEKTTKVSVDDVNKYRPLLFQLRAVPFKPMKVYKYKEFDRKTNSYVITQQKEIEVVGENRHNYFYLKGGEVGSIPKDEVSKEKIEKEDLEVRYMERINEIGKLKEKNEQLMASGEDVVPASGGGIIERGVNAILDRFLNTMSSARPDGGLEFRDGEVVKKEEKNMSPLETYTAREELKSSAKSAAFGAVDEATGIFQGAGERVMDEMAESQGPYAHDEEYFKPQKLQMGKTGELTPESKKKLEQKIKKDKKLETAKYPKGYKAAYDVEFKGGTEKEIEAAKKEVDDKFHRDFRGEKKSWRPGELEENSALAGAAIENIAEFMITHKISKKIISKIPGVKSNKIAKYLLTNANQGMLFGTLQGFKDSDKKSWEVLKKGIEEAAVFTAGGAALKPLGKLKPVTASGLFGKRLGQAGAFAAGSEVARTPFLKDEEKTLKSYAERSLTSFAMGAAFESVTSNKSIREQLQRNARLKLNAKVSKEITKKYGLDRSVKGLTLEQQDKLAEEATVNLVADVGRKVKEQAGSYNPMKIAEYLSKDMPGNPRISVEGTLISPKQFAKVDITHEFGHIKDIKISYNKNKSKEEIAGAMLHEFKHVENMVYGAEFIPGKKVKRPKTVYDLIASKGHHKGMENFEIAYLQDMLAGKGIKPGKVSSGVDKSPTGEFTLTDTGEIVSAEMSLYQRAQKSLKDIQPRGSVELGTDNATIWQGQKGSLKDRAKNSAKRMYEFMINETYSGEKVGESTKHRLVNYTKHHGTSHVINTDRLVGRDGRQISERNFVKYLDAGKNNVDYDNYLKLNLHLERMNVKGSPKPIFFKNDKPLSREETKAKISQLESTFPEFKANAQELYQNIDDFSREWLKNLVKKDNLDKMRSMYKSYVSIMRVLPEHERGLKANTISANVIKAASGGKQDLAPVAYSMPKYVQKVVRSDRKNSIYLSMLENVINANGGLNDYATVLNPNKIKSKAIRDKIKGLTKLDDGVERLFANMENQLVSDPVQGNFLIALEKGEAITMQIHDDALWKVLNKINTADLSEPAAILRGIKKAQNVFKNVWTRYNPIFWAFRNPMRDVPTSFIQTKNNPLSWASGMVTSAVDVMREVYPVKKLLGRSDLLKRYKALGNEQSNFIKSEMALTPTKFQKVLNLISGVGQGFETLPRYAEFKQSYKKWKPKLGHEKALERASYDASEVTVNFSRGGPGGRFIDAGVPYMNAKLQGLDKTIRTFKDQPIGATLKALGVLTLPTAAVYMINKNVNSENYDNLPNHVKDNYYPIPLEDGNFLKVPKNNAYALVFSTLFERLYQHMEDEPDAWKGIGDSTLKQVVVPQEVLTSDFLGPIRNILTGNNKDFFGRDIVPPWMLSGKSKRSPQYQYDERTSKPAIKAGEIVKMSPKQIDYLIKSYAGIIGSIYFAVGNEGDMYNKSQAMGVTTSSKYGKREMQMYEDRDKAQMDVSDFELKYGIDEIRREARERGITSNKKINERIKVELGASSYRDWMELKEKRKEKEEIDIDWD